MKVSLIIMPLFLWYLSDAQTPSDFKGTKWFAINVDSSFFKADTVRLVKNIVQGDKLRASPESYTQNQDFILLSFYATGLLSVEQVSISRWDITKLKGQYNWRFNSKNNCLSILFNGKVVNSLSFLAKRKVAIENAYNDPKLLETEEITFIRR